MAGADLASAEPRVRLDPAAGSVTVTVPAPAVPAEVWRALSDPGLVRRWLGELSLEPRAGALALLEFGDGDFFVIEYERVEPPRALELSWSFMGTSPRDRIRWTIAPAPAGAAISVSDTRPERDRAECRELGEGWSDFLGRLVRFLATGERTRYDWREELDVSIELPCAGAEAVEAILRQEAVRRRLALDDDGLPPAPDHVRLAVPHPECDGVTTCEIATSPRSGGVLLGVHHTGWRDLDLTDAERRSARHRFADFWVATLHEAGRQVHEPADV